MTEADWLSCTTRPAAMLRHVRAKAGRRKLQLLSCACCRLVWEHIPDERLRAAVGAAERFADGEASENEYASALAVINEIGPDRAVWGWADMPAACESVWVVRSAFQSQLLSGLERAIGWTVECAGREAGPAEQTASERGRLGTRNQVCNLFREIIGNPFRPWAIPAGYPSGGLFLPDGRRIPLTDAVYYLAAGVQADQAFDRLPVLADAAEEAGVTDRELLDHLRHGTGHVRGCWALGVLLGKG